MHFHKPTCSFRIITSSIDNPLYSIDFILHDIISEQSPNPFSKIEKLSSCTEVKNKAVGN